MVRAMIIASLEPRLCLCGCGESFIPSSRMQRYKNTAHRNKAANIRAGRSAKAAESRICKGCGIEFETNDNKRKFHSLDCASDYAREKDKLNKRRLYEKKERANPLPQEFLVRGNIKYAGYGGL